MAGAKWNELLRLLRQVDVQGQTAGTTDGQLLDRFVHQHDESAFELLLFRHGAMVLNVCRRILKRDQDAEDAFQATFLTLVRRAHSIRQRDALAGWLYRVAYRAALEARTHSARIARHEGPAQLTVEAAAVADSDWRELHLILDEEMGQLPERFRLPLMLCYLEGKTNEQAARELGCPAGTVFSRLAKGRELLRKRLVRRGLTLSTGGLTALVANYTLGAGPSPTLLTAALQVGRQTAAGKVGAVSYRVNAITEGVLKAMFLKKLKNATAVLLALALLAAGGGLVYHALMAAPPAQLQFDPPSGAPQAKDDAKNKQPDKADQAEPLRLVSPKKGGVEHMCEQSGTLTAFEVVEVLPQVPGMLKKLKVDIGDRVKKGDLLAEIDVPDLVKDVEQAKITLELAKAKIVQQEAQIESVMVEQRSAQTAIKQREAELAISMAEVARWKQELKRVTALLEKKVVDQQTRDETFNQLQASNGRVDAAKAAVEMAKTEKELKQSRVRLAQIVLSIEKLHLVSAHVGLERAEIILGLARITAPFDGIVTTRNVYSGDVISAKNNASILRIIRTDLMRLVVLVSQQDAVHVRVGMPVSIRIGAEQGKTIKAKVARISSSLDQKTGTMRVEADVPNPEGLLMDGMYCNSSVKLGILRPSALTIPRSCLIQKESPNAVFVAKEGKAVLTKIVGQIQGGLVEVYSGLNADDLVVDHPQGLKNGSGVPKK